MQSAAYKKSMWETTPEALWFTVSNQMCSQSDMKRTLREYGNDVNQYCKLEIPGILGMRQNVATLNEKQQKETLNQRSLLKFGFFSMNLLVSRKL